jgi:hypothetical protein
MIIGECEIPIAGVEVEARVNGPGGRRASG